MDYVRLYMLMKLSESLTDEEKQLLAGRDRESQHKEVMNELARIKKQGGFGLDLTSNIVGNITYEAAVWLARKLFKRIH